MISGIFELAIIVLTAAVLGILTRLLRQPVILAYILTGLLIGIFGYFHVVNKEIFQTFSDLGIMFLLFMIGLEINYTSLRLVGRTSLVVGLAQIIFTFIIGFAISLLFGFSYLHSTYVAIALTFSSTIIVVKLLSEKKDLSSLYGKISIGFLLVQDFVAILILIFLAGIGRGGGPDPREILLTSFKGIALLALMFWLGRKILPLVFDKIAKSTELLFVASIGWCLGVATLVSGVGLSTAIGGFLAGLALANSSEHFQIASRIKPLRDFFILIFFVILGSSLASFNFSGIVLPIIAFSLFVLIGNPLIVLVIMGLMGYRKRTSFLCGVTVAQISEFSLILVALGYSIGHVTSEIVSLVTSVGIVTITLSTYLIIHNEKIFRLLSRFLSVFESRSHREETALGLDFDKSIILIGAHRVGQNIAASLPKSKLLIVDFDPDVISQMKKMGYTTLFGDVADAEIIEKSNLKDAELVISTSPDFEDNMKILDELKMLDKKPKLILRAENEEDAKIFYENGAAYVVLPHFTSGQYLGRSISVDPEFKILEQLKKKDLELLGQQAMDYKR